MASQGSAAPSDLDSSGANATDSNLVNKVRTTISSTANANVYTPLLASARVSNSRSTSSGTSKTLESSCGDGTLKTLPVVAAKQVNRPTLALQSQNSRAQRSSVRPFFCCGSEVSLVSLVEGLDVKDTCSSDKNINSDYSSSSDEEYTAHTNSFRKSSASRSYIHSGESRHAVMRRKLKDKHNAKKKSWSLRFRGRWNPRWRLSQSQHSASHRFDLPQHSTSGTYQKSGSPRLEQRSPMLKSVSNSNQFIDLSHVQDFDSLYPVSDVDALKIRERAEEMRTGIEVESSSLSQSFRPLQSVPNSLFDIHLRRAALGSVNSDSSVPSPGTPTDDLSVLMNSVLLQWQSSRNGSSVDICMTGSPRIHTQVDFIHCLVPDLVKILSCPFYWGVMDRYEAERLLDNKPEGTFLLRDSAQEDFLFSVSFRRYNRSLHARVEQWNHRFSFDAHDPAVFSAPSVCELMEHYKDPCCCMFFEPMLTRPLPRNFPFSLQHICRAVICDHLVYDQIRFLPLPNSLKQFLQIYHYKQKVRVRRFDGPDLACADRNQTL